MSIRGFFRALRNPKFREKEARHSGHDLADKVRDTIGPLGGGGAGGRMTGSAVYRKLEDDEEQGRAAGS